MVLNKDILTAYFILDAYGNNFDIKDNRCNLYIEFQFNDIQNFKTTKLGYIIISGKRKYLFKDCKYTEAWVDGKNSNELNNIYLDKNGKILMDIHSDFQHNYNISFICNNIEVIEKKLITDEELYKLYDKIENNSSPRIT
jgi:hypothetical protein